MNRVSTVIGGHLAERFVSNGHDVVVLDNFDPFYDTRIKEHTVEICREQATNGDGKYQLVEGDVRNTDLVSELVSDAEYVYHQAAQAGVRPSVKNPRKYDEVNVDGTLNVLDAARDTGVKRVVFASSSSVYGRPEYLPYDEVPPTTPVSPYVASKLAAEQMEEGATLWRRRWFAKPGLTGLAQINDVTGFDPETKLRYDIEYIRNQSFSYDLKIVIRQMWIVGEDIFGLVATD